MKALYNCPETEIGNLFSRVDYVIKLAKNSPDGFDRRRVIENYAYSLSGDHNRKERQDVCTYLNGSRSPIEKCGVNTIARLIHNKVR